MHNPRNRERWRTLTALPVRMIDAHGLGRVPGDMSLPYLTLLTIFVSDIAEDYFARYRPLIRHRSEDAPFTDINVDDLHFPFFMQPARYRLVPLDDGVLERE